MRRRTFAALRRKVGTNELTRVRYSIGALLGSGMDAICRECLEGPEGTVRAVKIFQPKDKPVMRLKFRQEVQVLRRLQHPRLVRLVSHAEDSDYCYLVMTICNGGSLHKTIQNCGIMDERRAAFYIRQTLEGLAYMHTSRVIHRDIKPANLLLHDGNIKIADFGYAVVNESEQTKFCGTPNYMAPEIVDGTGYSYGVDIWALGITLYRMLYGRTPYRSSTPDETYELIRSRTPIPYPNTISATAIDFLHAALVMDPGYRFTAAQLLEHPFVNTQA
jgi:serine/threonine protein kinase